ncbi:MAG: hypothetical protein AABY22_11695 [Nanoarchaeota archaeon]
MFAADEDDTNSTKLTDFDLARLEDLDVGESFEGEYGNFKILRYKNSYVVFLKNCFRRKDFNELATKEQVIEFLNK